MLWVILAGDHSSIQIDFGVVMLIWNCGHTFHKLFFFLVLVIEALDQILGVLKREDLISGMLRLLLIHLESRLILLLLLIVHTFLLL